MRLRSLYQDFDHRDYSLQFHSMRALIVLGPKAEAAIPYLSRLAKREKPVKSRAYAISVLEEMGERGFVALVGVLDARSLSNDQWMGEDIRLPTFIAVNAWRYPAIARGAIPALRRMERDASPTVAAAGTNLLDRVENPRPPVHPFML